MTSAAAAAPMPSAGWKSQITATYTSTHGASNSAIRPLAENTLRSVATSRTALAPARRAARALL